MVEKVQIVVLMAIACFAHYPQEAVGEATVTAMCTNSTIQNVTTTPAPNSTTGGTSEATTESDVHNPNIEAVVGGILGTFFGFVLLGLVTLVLYRNNYLACFGENCAYEPHHADHCLSYEPLDH